MALTTLTHPVYLMDFACFKPPEECRGSVDICTSAVVDPECRPFFKKVLMRSGLSHDGTYLPPDAHPILNPGFSNLSWEAHEREAKQLFFGSCDELFKKSQFKPNDIDILITVSSTYCPIPSLASMVIQNYKMREDTRNYHLGGMGCSMGVVVLELVLDLLKARPGSRIMTVFAELGTTYFYSGKEMNMYLATALFRMGSAACVFSDRMWFKDQQAKMQLKHYVRVHTGGKDPGAYTCIQRISDPQGHLGLYLDKDLPNFVGKAVARAFKLMTPKIMTWWQMRDAATAIFQKKVLKAKVPFYKPDFTKCCDHFLLHAGGYSVLKSFQTSIGLPSDKMIPSFATLRDYGNISGSTTWYSLAYLESMGTIKKNQVVMQLGVGSGIKVGLAIWHAVRDVQDDHVAWAHLKGVPLNQDQLPRRIDEAPHGAEREHS